MEVIQLSFALMEFVSDGSADQRPPCFLCTAANHATFSLLNHLKATYGDAPVTRQALQHTGALPVCCALLHLWQRDETATATATAAAGHVFSCQQVGLVCFC
jgi:hypothetical protein